MLDVAADRGASLTLLPVIAADMDARIEKGHGGEDWTVIAKDALE